MRLYLGGFRAVRGGDEGFVLRGRACCLTIESEEREAWTADVLADLISRERGLVEEETY